jgi:hypothetical protein
MRGEQNGQQAWRRSLAKHASLMRKSQAITSKASVVQSFVTLLRRTHGRMKHVRPKQHTWFFHGVLMTHARPSRGVSICRRSHQPPIEHQGWRNHQIRCARTRGLAHRRAHRLGGDGPLRSEPASDHLSDVCGPTGRGLSDPTKGMCASTQLSPAQLAAPQHFHLPLEGYILYALVVDLLVTLLAIPGPHKP